MEKEKKRVVFGEEERAKVRQLVIERKDRVESKKSDLVTVAKKKQAWEEITSVFNSEGTFPKRTTVQLKKMWDNAKARRRAQLAVEKREVMRTGGGTQSVVISEDPELDSLGVDIELRDDAMDSDTLLAGSTNYVVVDDVLVPAANFVEGDDPDDPPITPQEVLISAREPSLQRRPSTNVNDVQVPSTSSQGEVTSPDQPAIQPPLLKKGSKYTSTHDVASRVRRNEQFALQDRELHALRFSELQMKIKLLEQQILQGEELFRMKRENQELKRRKLMLEIRKLEGED